MSHKLIEESKELIQNLSVIEERHLLELLAVHSGLKNVMRIHIANEFRKQRTKDRFDLDEARNVKASSNKFKKVGS